MSNVDGSGDDNVDGSGDVDRYLDEMFDRLAGTGAAGRRALAEAEDHLRAAVAEEMARGVPAAQAERAAVARFGPSAEIVAQLRQTHGRLRLGSVIWLGSVISGAWLLVGLALALLAITYLLKALDFAVLLRLHPQSAAPCLLGPGASELILPDCSDDRAAMRDNLRAGLLMLLLAAAVLLVRWLAIRRAGLAVTPPRFPLLAAALFASVAVGLFLTNPSMPHGSQALPESGFLGVPGGMGLYQQVIASGLALLISITAIGGYLTRIRRDR